MSSPQVFHELPEEPHHRYKQESAKLRFNSRCEQYLNKPSRDQTFESKTLSSSDLLSSEPRQIVCHLNRCTPHRIREVVRVEHACPSTHVLGRGKSKSSLAKALAHKKRDDVSDNRKEVHHRDTTKLHTEIYSETRVQRVKRSQVRIRSTLLLLTLKLSWET